MAADKKMKRREEAISSAFIKFKTRREGRRSQTSITLRERTENFEIRLRGEQPRPRPPRPHRRRRRGVKKVQFQTHKNSPRKSLDFNQKVPARSFHLPPLPSSSLPSCRTSNTLVYCHDKFVDICDSLTHTPGDSNFSLNAC